MTRKSVLAVFVAIVMTSALAVPARAATVLPDSALDRVTAGLLVVAWASGDAASSFFTLTDALTGTSTIYGAGAGYALGIAVGTSNNATSNVTITGGPSMTLTIPVSVPGISGSISIGMSP